MGLRETWFILLITLVDMVLALFGSLLFNKWKNDGAGVQFCVPICGVPFPFVESPWSCVWPSWSLPCGFDERIRQRWPRICRCASVQGPSRWFGDNTTNQTGTFGQTGGVGSRRRHFGGTNRCCGCTVWWIVGVPTLWTRLENQKKQRFRPTRSFGEILDCTEVVVVLCPSWIHTPCRCWIMMDPWWLLLLLFLVYPSWFRL